MVIVKNFWPIAATNTLKSYEPRENQGLNFAGVVCNDSDAISIKNVGPDVISNINNMIATSTQGVGMYGSWIPQNTKVVSCTETDITINTKVESGIMPAVTEKQLLVWNMDYPCSKAGDGPIQALLCIKSNHGPLSFIDSSGRRIDIPAGTLVKGAIYYFQISAFVQVEADEFIGFSGS